MEEGTREEEEEERRLRGGEARREEAKEREQRNGRSGEGLAGSQEMQGVPFMAFGGLDLSTSIDSQTSLLL